jgi:hypothetical protein
VKEDLNDSSARTGAGEMSEAEIDANVEGTFPASDPPAWTLGTDHRPAAGQERENDDGENGDGP